jgi:hypothetical protein
MDNDSGKGYYRRSFFGPILLILIGLAFLGTNLGLLPGEGWGSVWQYWPILLIVAGLDELIRRDGIAWPILLIAVGAFLLYNNLGPRTWISWTQLLQLWPILLIVGGIDLMFRGRSGWTTAGGVILAVALIGGAIWLTSSGYRVAANYADVRQVYPQGAESGEIDLALGSGELILSSTNASGVLIDGKITPEVKEEGLSEEDGHFSYQLKNNDPTLFPHTSRWEMKVGSNLPVNLNLNLGAGEMNLSAEELVLEDLDVDQGVGRMVISLPGSCPDEISIKQAIGTLLIVVPKDIKIVVDAKNGLSRVDFPADFELDEGYYSTPGADPSHADLVITVEQAIGLVTFQYAR